MRSESSRAVNGTILNGEVKEENLFGSEEELLISNGYTTSLLNSFHLTGFTLS